jgi:hypothetical protein
MECAQVVGESGAVTVICSAFRNPYKSTIVGSELNSSEEYIYIV